MADLVGSLAKSVVVGAVTKVQSAIEEEEKLWRIVDKDLVFITGEFEMMQSFLSVADEEAVRNNVVKTWVRQVRDLAYNLEDTIEYVIHLDKTPDWYHRCLPGFIRPELPLDKAVAEIKLLKGRVEEVSLRNMRYNLISDSGSMPVMEQQWASATSVATDTFTMLIEKDHTTMKQKGVADLSMLLTKKAGVHVAVVSVCGSPGNPYTTHIISEAYGQPEILANFGCRGWAKVTYPFNSHDFQRSLLIQFHANSCQQNESSVDVNTLKRLEAATEGELVQEFMEIMKEERYLVVLENISSMVEWEIVRAYLPDGRKGSWIIISTQKPEIARLCVGEPIEVLELKHHLAERSVFFFFRKGSQGGDRDKSKETTMLIPNNSEASSSVSKAIYKGGYAKYASIPTSANNAAMWMERFPLVGVRKSEMKDLRGYIARARVYGFPVVSVWGIAGVGKSALVRNLYYDIMYHSSNRIFTMYSWVDLSHPFNLWNLAWSLLSELQSDSCQQNGISNPLQECHEFLEKHRCLVVIDGLQSTEEWDLICRSLVSTHSRSIIVVITTEASIAIHCANREEAMYNVKSLEHDEACDLSKKEVGMFPDASALRDSEDPELRKLISKCGGLPKVIVAVADLLAPMSVSWMRRAVNLSDRFMHDLETKPEFDNLHGLFSWMHYYLRTCPDFLRPCIFYLSIFPQGQNIRRRRLVKRWIAEGYSRDTYNRSAEEVGEQFFSMLLDLNIIQQPPHSVTTADRRMVFCHVNGFFREYISSRKDEDLIFELEGRCNLTTQRTGRHLVINYSWDRDMIVFNGINFSGLRSLTVFGEWKSFLVCAAMKVLRVLDLENAIGVTDKDLEHILKLVHSLKFLSLRGCTEICHLPSSLGDLRQLQTLDVRGTSIVHIPKFITKLKKLQYIRAGRRPFSATPSTSCAQLYCLPWPRRYGSVGIDVSRGIEKLTALHTLGVVNVGLSGGKAILKEVKKLTQLHKLEVTGINKKNSNEFCSAISDHVHLESLSVWLITGEPCLNEMFSPQKEAPENLQSLKLYGLVKEVPAWIRDLPKLTKLHVNMAISKNVNISEVLGEIKGLCILRLDIRPLEDGDGDLNFCVKANGAEQRSYLNVRILEIACNSELNVSFGSLAMENLELLIAKCCGSAVKFAELKSLSKGKLKEVRYLGSLDNTVKMDMENQLNQHPKTPALKLEEPCLP